MTPTLRSGTDALTPRKRDRRHLASVHHDVLMIHCPMRTTIDLPEDLHRIALSIARDRHQTLSAAVADLIRQGLGSRTGGEKTSDRDGFPVVTVGRVITAEDVRSLDDE